MPRNSKNDSSKESLSPPLKWAGGKRWLVPHLRRLYAPHKHRRFVEPFVGGMAATLGLSPKKALLSDSNPFLINFYRWLQKGLVIDTPFEHDEAFFYAQRDAFNVLVEKGQLETKDGAALFYYLNRTCFNGLCRVNSKGKFNVPFGKYKSIRYTKDFSKYRAVMKGWEFACGDFSSLEIEPVDFLYVDPPYDVEFTQYAKDNFSFEDQKRLVAWLQNHKGPIVASNQATPRIVKLYEEAGFTVEIVDAPRRISSSGDRTPAKEVVCLKNLVC